jgi:hypothetical protein
MKIVTKFLLPLFALSIITANADAQVNKEAFREIIALGSQW